MHCALLPPSLGRPLSSFRCALETPEKNTFCSAVSPCHSRWAHTASALSRVKAMSGTWQDKAVSPVAGRRSRSSCSVYSIWSLPVDAFPGRLTICRVDRQGGGGMPCDSLSGGVGKQHCNLTALASKCDVHAGKSASRQHCPVCAPEQPLHLWAGRNSCPAMRRACGSQCCVGQEAAGQHVLAKAGIRACRHGARAAKCTAATVSPHSPHPGARLTWHCSTSPLAPCNVHGGVGQACCNSNQLAGAEVHNRCW